MISTMNVPTSQRLMSLALLCILIVSIVAQQQNQKRGRYRFRGRVNCERYVYAPVCRGVAAKRGVMEQDLSAQSDDVERGLEKAILRSFLSYQKNRNKAWGHPVRQAKLLEVLSQGAEDMPLASQLHTDRSAWLQKPIVPQQEDTEMSWPASLQDLGSM